MGEADKYPLISVIVPIYNVEPYLRKCVDSIISQTYRNLEIILVDDGSPDHCPEICDEYAEKDSRIIVIHKPNGGLSDARNAGLKQFKGEYVMFVDSDDWIDETYIYNMYESIGNANVVISGCTYTTEEGIPYEKKLPGTFAFMDLIDNSMFGYACLKLYRKKAISNQVFKEILREDLIFNLRLLNSEFSKCFSIVSRTGYYYRQRSNSILHSPAPYPKELLCEMIDLIDDAIQHAVLSEKEKHFAYNRIIYTLLSDACSRLPLCKVPYVTSHNYISALFSKIPKNSLLLTHANNYSYKAIWIAHRLKLIFPYIIFLKLIHRN